MGQHSFGSDVLGKRAADGTFSISITSVGFLFQMHCVERVQDFLHPIHKILAFAERVLRDRSYDTLQGAIKDSPCHCG